MLAVAANGVRDDVRGLAVAGRAVDHADAVGVAGLVAKVGVGAAYVLERRAEDPDVVPEDVELANAAGGQRTGPDDREVGIDGEPDRVGQPQGVVVGVGAAGRG